MWHLITTIVDYQTSGTCRAGPALHRAVTERTPALSLRHIGRTDSPAGWPPPSGAPEDTALAGSSRIPWIHSRPCGQHTHYAHSMDTARQDPGGQPLPWAAPQADGPLRARLRVPGSKSMTNRALVLAALADGPTGILNPLLARDTLLMAGALRAIGATVDTGTAGDAGAEGTGTTQATGATGTAEGAGTTEGRGAAAWRVSPGWATSPARVDVGNAGTVMRFVPPVAALASVPTGFHGDPRAPQRPGGAIISALRELGAVMDDGGRGAIPFTVHGTGSLAGGSVTVDASASSQLVSGLLLAAPRYDKGLEVRHRGGRAPSAPHIAMTVQMLREAGAPPEADPQS